MSNKKNTTHIGFIKDAFGLKGELVVHLLGAGAPWIKKLKSVDLESQTYKVVAARPHKMGLTLRVEGVDDRTAAEKLIGSKLFIDASLLVSKPGEAIFLGEILGFEVTHESLGAVGRIVDFGTNGAQDLLVIEDQGKRYEVPFIKEFVVEMSFQKRLVHMNFPEGLRSIDE